MPNILTQRAPSRRANSDSKTTEWNPIVVREGRARWRGARAFWLALAYAGFLSAVLWFCYSDSQRRSSFGGSGMDSIGAAAQLGHELFGVLCWCQLGAWLLLAPLLTASSISGERQKGLLEGLLLSRLLPSQIVRGKWASALGLIVLLQLAGLPVAAVCFVMGGVSPGEFVGAFAIQLATACCGAAIGVLFSAQSRTNNDSASGAIFGVLLWLLATGIACLFRNIDGYIAIFSECIHLLAAANPIAAMVQLLAPMPQSNGTMPLGLWSALFGVGCGWMLAVAGMALLSMWCLHRAGKILSRSPKRFDQPGASQAAASTCNSLASSAESQEREEFLYAGNMRPQTRPESSPSRPDERWEMPILNRIIFGNAMLRRELSHLWRWPTMSWREKMWVTLLLLFFGLVAIGILYAIFDSARNARDTWPVILTIYGIAGAVLCAARPASSIAHERECGMWQSLNLTMLSPQQITAAKIAGPIVAACGYGFGAWIFLLLAAWQG